MNVIKVFEKINFFIISMICVLIVIGIFYLNLLSGIEDRLSDAFFQFEMPISDNVWIIEIDEKTVEKFGNVCEWPADYMI